MPCSLDTCRVLARVKCGLLLLLLLLHSSVRKQRPRAEVSQTRAVSVTDSLHRQRDTEPDAIKFCQSQSRTVVDLRELTLLRRTVGKQSTQVVNVPIDVVSVVQRTTSSGQVLQVNTVTVTSSTEKAHNVECLNGQTALLT